MVILLLSAGAINPASSTTDPEELFSFALNWRQEDVGPEQLDFLPQNLLCLLGGECPTNGGEATGLDFGDAPDSYRTSFGSGPNGGARHQTGAGGPFLGVLPPDPEEDGFPNPHAEGDDGERREDRLDRTFGGDGVVEGAFGNGVAVFDAAIQQDGKIVSVGFVQVGSATTETDMAVIRHNADGTLDTDFGVNGVALIDFGVDREAASSVAIQNDEKIVIGGKTLDPPANDQRLFYVARLDQNGMPDVGFSEDGKATFDLSDPCAGVNDVAVTQVDGFNKILAVGTTFRVSGSTDRIAVTVQFNDDGAPNMEFGASGRRTYFGTANKIYVQTEGRLLVAGSDGSTTDEDYQILQLDEEGDFTSFGDFGIFNLDQGSPDEEFVDLLEFPNGSIIGLAGNPDDFVLLGIDLFGDGLDSDFGIQGVATATFGGGAKAKTILQRLDGRLTVVGGVQTGGTNRVAMAVFLGDGSPDEFFAENGTAEVEIPGLIPEAAVLQTGEKVVAVGNGETDFSAFMLARFGAFEDDEDGVLIEGGMILERGQAAQARVLVNGGNGAANLFGWIDFNGNGSFSDPGEQVANGMGAFASLGNGEVMVDFTVPNDATVGNTYSRWRVSTSGGLSFDGEAPDGEVEDYRLCLVDRAMKPTALCQITLVESGMGGSSGISISADGSRRVFTSNADLTGGNPDRNFEVFLFDAAAGALTQITHTRPPTNSSEPFLSGNGSTVFFFSTGDLAGDNFSRRRQVFSFDIAAGEFTQWTFDDPFFDSSSQYESLTVDHSGARAAFLSNADLTDENSDGNYEVYLLDAMTGSLTQVTNHTTSTLPGEVSDPMISGNGGRIVFTSDVDFTGNNPDRSDEIFVYDIDAPEFTQITSASDAFLRVPKISFDGGRVVFDGVSNIAGANPDGNQEVFLYDFPSAMVTQITQTNGSLNVSPWISGDGFRISFQSNADFAGENPDGGHEVFLYDTRNSSYIQVTQGSDNVPFQSSALNSDGTRIGLSGTRDLTGENPDGNGEVYVGTIPAFTNR